MRRERRRSATKRAFGKALKTRGFRVVLNWHPPTETHGNAGEVDLICARDGIVFVIEVKSAFVRKSQRDTWLHATTTLRRAGQQLQREVAAVLEAFAQGSELANCLGLELSGDAPPIHGWIVDTSIERDHQRFSGFLKLSLEELLIALRDDRRFIDRPPKFCFAAAMRKGTPNERRGPTLRLRIPSGFSAKRFIDAIEAEVVWALI